MIYLFLFYLYLKYYKNDLKNELRGLISSPILKDGDKVSLEIGNPYLVDYKRSKLKKLGHSTRSP